MCIKQNLSVHRVIAFCSIAETSTKVSTALLVFLLTKLLVHLCLARDSLRYAWWSSLLLAVDFTRKGWSLNRMWVLCLGCFFF